VIAAIAVIARDRKGKLTAEARRRLAKSKTLTRMIADQE
jgi:hypothetical protein